MLLKECAIVGLKELWANKVRSFLSALGIIIGIISLVVMMAIMGGIEKTWLDYIEQSGGLTKATVNPVVPTVNGLPREDLKHDLTLEDAALIKKQKNFIQWVSPEISDYKEVGYRGRKWFYAEVIGGNRDSLAIGRQQLTAGRLISEADVRLARNVCILGSEAKKELFGTHANPLGKTVEIEGLLFQVVGALEANVSLRQGQNILDWKNKMVYVPITVFWEKWDKKAKIQAIHYVTRGKKDISRAKKEILRLLSQKHGMAGDIEIETMEESYQQSKKSLKNMKVGFSLIAGISLIVGGIGIMNIMIASIAQRVKEIGIRKAIGAKSRDILTQFLLESVIVSAIGGILGILSSLAVVGLVSLFSKDSKPVILPGALIFSWTFSLVIGTVFGVYPAMKASKLDPIKALRYQ
jgi:ABC-type antimicrobial peptide transport system permease subunit